MYIKYTIKNISFDELDKIVKDYISTHNKTFVFYLISCELIIENNKNFTENIKTNYYYNTVVNNIKRDLIYNIYHFLPKKKIVTLIISNKQILKQITIDVT